MATFGAAERRIAELLKENEKFILNNEEYTIVRSGKPTCAKGEPKTDIYVEAESDSGDRMEIKISYKKENANFLENKTNAERAEAIFGANWQSIISNETTSIQDAFEERKLIYKNSAGKSEKGAITLGWKYELLNVKSGSLSNKIDLTREQILDAYAGTHLPEDKRNASVNGTCIENCGIANYFLMKNSVNSTQEIIDSLYSIEKYVDDHPDVYFACKALNYRTFKKKYDGNRPLSVYVRWYVEDQKLCHELCFDNPLDASGDEVAASLIDALEELHIQTTDDITSTTVSDSSIINS